MKRKKGVLDWLVMKLRPGSHISRNPKKGARKVKVSKTVTINTEGKAQ